MAGGPRRSLGTSRCVSDTSSSTDHLPITVAIPTHDRREALLLAIDSVLAQTHPVAELIVVADGCTDGTVEALEAHTDARVRVIDCPKGPGSGYANRNRALDSAAAEVIAWCSDDDLWLPGHLSRIAEIHGHADVDIVTTRASYVQADDTITPLGMDWSIPGYRHRLLQGENRTPSTAVSHRVDLALQVDGWRDDPGMPGDLDLWQRMLLAGGRAALSSEPTALHFSKAGRGGQYERRIEQTKRFLARMRDPRQLVALELDITRGHETHAALQESNQEGTAAFWEQRFAAEHERRAELASRLDAVTTERERALAHGELLARDLDRELERAVRRDEELDLARRRYESLRETSVGWERDAAELRAVYAGRWWRLRQRLRLR